MLNSTNINEDSIISCVKNFFTHFSFYFWLCLNYSLLVYYIVIKHGKYLNILKKITTICKNQSHTFDQSISSRYIYVTELGFKLVLL